MPVGAAISAVGSIGGALIGSSASQNAANAQVGLGEQALAQQQNMFNTAQNALQPFISSGQSVLPTLQGLLTPGPNQNVLLSQTPGFQFANQYGLMAAQNALTSRGLGASAGPEATAAAQFSSGLASNTFSSLVNALQGFANTGAGAAGSLASGAIQSGNSQAGTLTGIGSAAASGILGSANALSGGLTGSTNALSSAALLSALTGGGLAGSSQGLFSGSSIPGAVGPTSVNGGLLQAPLPGS
jgi:hypothetical protein